MLPWRGGGGWRMLHAMCMLPDKQQMQLKRDARGEEKKLRRYREIDRQLNRSIDTERSCHKLQNSKGESYNKT